MAGVTASGSHTQKLPVSKEPGDLAHQYNSFLCTVPICSADDVNEGDTVIKLDGDLRKPLRLANGLYRFRSDTGEDRVVLDCINALQNGADLLWIETEKPHVGQIAGSRRSSAMRPVKLAFSTT